MNVKKMREAPNGLFRVFRGGSLLAVKKSRFKGEVCCRKKKKGHNGSKKYYGWSVKKGKG